MIPPAELVPAPARSYDDLMELSMRRGRRLRLRRRIVTTLPVVVSLIAAVGVGVPTLMGHTAEGTQRLRVVTPATHDHPHAAPVRQLQQPGNDGSAHGAVSVGSSQQMSTGSAVGSQHNVRPPSVAVAPHKLSPATVTFADAIGDGTPQGAAAQTASDPSLDITQMAFTADANGIRITMQLAGAYRDDGLYDALFTDQTTGCTYTAVVGGAYHDSITWTCGSSSASQYLPATVDPRTDLLVCYVPYDLMNSDVRPTDPFTQLQGITYIANAANTRYDTASTTKVLRQQ